MPLIAPVPGEFVTNSRNHTEFESVCYRSVIRYDVGTLRDLAILFLRLITTVTHESPRENRRHFRVSHAALDDSTNGRYHR